MIDTTAKMALTQVINILEGKADQVSDMSVEGMFDRQSIMTLEHAAAYLEDLRVELSLEIGQVIASLKEVSPSQEPQAVV